MCIHASFHSEPAYYRKMNAKLVVVIVTSVEIKSEHGEYSFGETINPWKPHSGLKESGRNWYTVDPDDLRV